MDFSGFMDSLVFYVQNNTLIAMVIAAGLLFLIYRKPRVFFSILVLGLILAVSYYLITSMAGSGSNQKKRLIHEQKQLDTDR